ncbi:MAG: hypothetical protein LBU62_11345, partial [Bacteroidales bacterium]|nr:hypothetical protein [Bacteroidales bacterium]
MKIFCKYSVSKFLSNAAQWVFSFRHLPVKLLLAILCLIVFGKLVEYNILFRRFDQRHADKIQKIFLQKEAQLDHHVENIKQGLDTPNPTAALTDLFHTYKKLSDEQGLRFFIYRNDSLQYWSTHRMPVQPLFAHTSFDKPYVSTNNGRYAAFLYPYKEYKIVGLILLKYVYSYDNQYIKKAFQKDFGLPEQVKIFPEWQPGYYPVHNSSGNFVWALIFDDTCVYQYQKVVPSVAYLMAIIVLFFLVDIVFRQKHKSIKKYILLSLCVVGLVVLRYAILVWQIPGILHSLALFDPVNFASDWFTSLGGLCLWGLFIGFFVFEYYRYSHFPDFTKHRWKYSCCITFQMIVVVIYAFGVGLLIKTLVINSTDMFETPNRTLLLNGFTFIGYLLILMFLFSLGLLLDKLLLFCRNATRLSQLLIFYIIALSAVLIGWLISGFYVGIPTIVILSVMV